MEGVNGVFPHKVRVKIIGSGVDIRRKDAEIKFKDRIMTFNDNEETKVDVRHLNDHMRPYKRKGLRISTYKKNLLTIQENM